MDEIKKIIQTQGRQKAQPSRQSQPQQSQRQQSQQRQKPQQERPKKPQFTARDWANQLNSNFNKEGGSTTATSNYLKRVVNSPLINNRAYKGSLSTFFSETIILLVKRTDDPQLMKEIGSILKQEEKVQDIWIRASADIKITFKTIKKRTLLFLTTIGIV